MIQHRNRSLGERLVDGLIALFMILVVVVTLYPFLHVLAVSLNASDDTVKGGLTIFPRVFTLDNYKAVWSFGNIPHAFLISVLRTVVGTLLSLAACSLLAYTLSRRDFMLRRFLSNYLAVTLYVSGGLIPFFLLIRDLNLMNTFWVYVLPGIINAFYVFMIRSYMDGLPYELQESAKLDGANDFTIFLRVVLPLCTPVLATIALFMAVGQWNSWFDTYLFNGSNPALTTLQYELMKILQTTQVGQDAVMNSNLAQTRQQVTPESLKMAITIITTAPILLLYPFLQRYFVHGMTLGAVKG
jgi:putative aldouronate transport system permease protein